MSTISIILIRGSLYVAVGLLALLVFYDIVHNTFPRARLLITAVVIIYLLLSLRLVRKGKVVIANWLLIILYQLITATALLNWGLESMVGILTASFTVLLPGILMAPRHILRVTIMTFVILITIFLLQTSNVISPQQYTPKEIPSIFDILAYCTILSVFALVSWVSSHQSSISLNRALKAEEATNRQKENLAIELNNQSSKLRQAQLKEMQQLYKFAIIGQSASATLHELSNYLSVLNLDIDDLKQQHTHSKAIKNAQASVDHINSMVRKTRAQLSAQNTLRPFEMMPVLRQTLIDIEPQFQQKKVALHKVFIKSDIDIMLFGDSLSLMQVVTILIKNALDACKETPNAAVHFSVKSTAKNVIISVRDNGPGVNDSIRPSLFKPVTSMKPSGLGVGLYIAKHLIQSQFNGSLDLKKSNENTCFQIKIKKWQEK